jgi:hypothetical protein
MTHKELTDDLAFLAAEQMLGDLTAQGLLSDEEAELVRKELKRRFRPTLLTVSN